MSRQRIDGVWLAVSMFAFLCLSGSFLLMPLEGGPRAGTISLCSLLGGLLFWVSLLVGVATQVLLAYQRRMRYARSKKPRDKGLRRIGLLCFFRNRYAAVADCVAAGSLLGLIASLLLTRGSGYVCFIFLSVFLFSFSLHCILNGRIFLDIQTKTRSFPATEGKTNQPTKKG